MATNLISLDEIPGKTVKACRIEDSKNKKSEHSDEIRTKVLVIEFTDGSEIRLEASLDSMGIYNSNGGYTSYWPTLAVEKRLS